MARYEVSEGIYHYVIPCSQKLDKATTPDTKPANAPPALCWPVILGQVQMIEGKPQSTVPINGTLMVSASTAQFIPDDVANKGRFLPEVPAAELVFFHNAGQQTGVVTTKREVYMFTFRPFCQGCVPGSPATPVSAAQLDSEFTEFGESLKKFDAVHKRISDLAAQWRVGVTPGNQPTVKDLPEAMGLYGEMNRKVATSCVEPAKSCIQNYEKYQLCKSISLEAECGTAPSCSASCVLTPEAFKALQVTFCLSPSQDSASLIPDWSEVAKKFETAQKTSTKRLVPSAAPTSAGPPLDFMGKPAHANSECTVQEGYSLAMMTHMAHSAGTMGIGKVERGHNLTLAPGAAASNLLIKTDPEYPAVAKAAHISGTVVLNVTISKTGTIEDMVLVSGPPLLQKSAMDAVGSWKYKPYLLLGQPVEVHTQVHVVYNLGAGEPTGTPAP